MADSDLASPLQITSRTFPPLNGRIVHQIPLAENEKIMRMEATQRGFVDETGFYTPEEWAAKQRHEQQIALLTEIRDLLKLIAQSSDRSG